MACPNSRVTAQAVPALSASALRDYVNSFMRQDKNGFRGERLRLLPAFLVNV